MRTLGHARGGSSTQYRLPVPLNAGKLGSHSPGITKYGPKRGGMMLAAVQGSVHGWKRSAHKEVHVIITNFGKQTVFSGRSCGEATKCHFSPCRPSVLNVWVQGLGHFLFCNTSTSLGPAPGPHSSPSWVPDAPNAPRLTPGCLHSRQPFSVGEVTIASASKAPSCGTYKNFCAPCKMVGTDYGLQYLWEFFHYIISLTCALHVQVSLHSLLYAGQCFTG